MKTRTMGHHVTPPRCLEPRREERAEYVGAKCESGFVLESALYQWPRTKSQSSLESGPNGDPVKQSGQRMGSGTL